MLTRKLGQSGLAVAAICLGGNVFGWTTDEKQSFAVLDAYVEGGGDFIDTADVYSRWAPGHVGGESEEIVGNWIKARGKRDQVIIATKVGFAMGDRPNQKGLSRQHIIQGIEASLRRLKTDYIDLYQAHGDDPATPLHETMRAFDDLIKQGKVRYIGASNYAAWRLMEALWTSDKHNLAPYVSVQPPYSLANRADFERELAPLCAERGIGVITYSSLASGFLTGKYRRDGALPTTPRAQGVAKRYMTSKGFAILDALESVAETHRATPAQVALAWLLTRPSVTAPIASATTPEQTREMLGAVDVMLSPDEIAALDQASAWQ